MDIVILDSALKHGISRESIYSCIYNYRSDTMLETPSVPLSPVRRFIVGFDYRGIALEIGAREYAEDDTLVVFHAMKLQKKHEHLLQGEADEL